MPSFADRPASRRSYLFGSRDPRPSSAPFLSDDPFEKHDRFARYPLVNRLRRTMQGIMATRQTRVVAAVAAVFLFSFILFSSYSSSSVTVLPTAGSTGSAPVADIPAAGSIPTAGSVPATDVKPVTDSKLADSKVDDTNPLECTKSFDGKKPVIQYAVVIDAGSSGSRVHVYKFNNCQATPRLLNETFEMLEPGLSSFDDDSAGAAASLEPLLKTALEAVPLELQKCTPIAVKATAGLRLKSEEKATRILAAVKNLIETKYPFPLIANGVEIMEGRDEGVYAWITANYLLGNIGSAEKTPTAAVFDLGGGSTQIVFEPEFAIPGSQMAPGDHKYDLSFGGREFSLYQYSHLNYGLNEARKRMDGLIVANQLATAKAAATGNLQIINPCLPPGAGLPGHKVTVVGVDGSKTPYTVDMIGPKEHSELQCRGIAESILNKDTTCNLDPCSFNGVHQPSLVDSFQENSDLYVFSFFYDRTYPLGMPSSFSLGELADLTAKVCHGPTAYDSFAATNGAVKALEANPQWCQELNFISTLLHIGYDIPGHREVKIAKKIKGNELGWCLGSSLPMLDQESSGWTCKA